MPKPVWHIRVRGVHVHPCSQEAWEELQLCGSSRNRCHYLQGLAEALQRSGSHRRDEAGQGCDSGERLDPFVTGLLQHREEEGKEKKIRGV